MADLAWALDVAATDTVDLVKFAKSEVKEVDASLLPIKGAF